MKVNDDIFVNIWDYKDDNFPFQIFIGGRGKGKTFSGLNGDPEKGGLQRALVDPEYKFLYARRTQEEAEMCQCSKGEEGTNPFKQINLKKGTNVGFFKINKKMSGIYEMDKSQEGKILPVGRQLGYGCGISTIGSMRSIDLTDVKDAICDEFIAEAHVRAIKNEGDMFLNAYESINRNRELEGMPPMNMYFISNSTNIYNPLFVVLGIVNICERMMQKGQEHYYDKKRGLAIHIFASSGQYEEFKRKSAIGRLTAGTKFYDSAIENKFSYNDFSLIGHRNLKGYIPICSIKNEVYIWKKKGSEEYYCTYAKGQCPNFNVESEQDRRAFVQRIGFAMESIFTSSAILFETYDIKQTVLDLIL